MRKGPFFDSKHPIIFAHRGASFDYPENTITAFQAAIKYGVQYLETDVHITKDGVIVVCHDDNVERIGGVNKSIGEMTLKEIEKIDAGANFTKDNGDTFPFRDNGIKIPTLEKLLTKFKDVRINIEIKDGTVQTTKEVLAIIKKHGAEERCLLATASGKAALHLIRKEAPEIATCACKGEVISFLAGSYLAKKPFENINFDALQVPEKHSIIRVVNGRFLETAKNFGVEVHVWTVDEVADMKRLLNMGVDGIMTNCPDLGLAVAKQYQH